MRRVQAGLALLAVAVVCAEAELVQAGTKPNHHGIPQRRLPFAGNGTCQDPVYDPESDTTTVQCLGPKHLLSPGQTIDTMMLLESPYPKDEVVVILNQSTQMVDDTLRPVPLSELYVHHYGSPVVLGSGAELRGSFSRQPLRAPYARVANGTQMQGLFSRMTNIQLINTVGLPAHQAKPCLECWCDHDPWSSSPVSAAFDPTGGHHPSKDRGDPTHNDTHPGSLEGSLLCCHQCPTTEPISGPFGYHLQYNTTYRTVKPGESIKATEQIGFDVMGGDFEYQLTEAQGPGASHIQEYDTVFDGRCPQKAPIEVVRCTGHQHFGGQCIELIDLDRNATICRTCPEFGTRPGVPGDEAGYVVNIPDDEPATPYIVQPGTRIRLRSKYDASVPRFGIMGLVFAWVSGLSEPCAAFPGTNNDAVTTPYGGMFADAGNCMMGVHFPSHDAAAVAAA